MLSGITDEPPGQITAHANAEQTDADDKPLPLPAATNARGEDDDDTAIAAIDACQGADVSRQMR
jgi:hypothetical protein